VATLFLIAPFLAAVFSMMAGRRKQDSDLNTSFLFSLISRIELLMNDEKLFVSAMAQPGLEKHTPTT
jgi:hypothetical protein